MKKILDRIKTKPEKVREQIAIIAAGAVTLLVVMVWVFSLENRFRSADTKVVDGQEVIGPDKPLNELFDSLGQSFKDQREEMKATNPFRYDESANYQNETAIGTETEVTEQNPDQGTSMQPSVLSVDTDDTTTENDTSKDQISQ